MRWLIVIAGTLLSFQCHADWSFSSTKDPMTDETVRTAGASSDQIIVAIFRAKDGKAWMSVGISDASLDMFEPDTPIALRVDANQHLDYKRRPPLNIRGIPDVPDFLWSPKRVSFLIWHGDDSQGRAKLLEQMMSGETLLLRYVSTGGRVRDVRIGLNKAGPTISQSLGIPLVQSDEDRESTERWRYRTQVFNSCGRKLECMKEVRDCPVPGVSMEALKACLDGVLARHQ